MVAEVRDRHLWFALVAMRLNMVVPEEILEILVGLGEGDAYDLPELLIARGMINDTQRKLIESMIDERVESNTIQQEPGERGCSSEQPQDATVPMLRDATHDTWQPNEGMVGDVSSTLVERLTVEFPGQYQRRSVLGFGGQARVLLAFDNQIGREIAIKELDTKADPKEQETNRSTSRQTQRWITRFLREARITGQLEHPNIVPVYELGRRLDGTLYYAMRRVRGKTLAAALADCHSLADRMKLLRHFVDTCYAVAYAHNRGVIHRDIKPSNVMVGEFGETVLLDWGVAKARGIEDHRGRELLRDQKLLSAMQPSATMAGMALGTPAYMSPEQAQGEIDSIDEVSDIYGLGALLYEILTGEPPFSGANPHEVLRQVAQGGVDPVLQRASDAPPELAAVAEKAVQKNKAERQQNAAELADDVSAFMTGGRVGAYEYGSWELLSRFARKNWKAIVVGCLVLVTVVVSLIVISILYRREQVALVREHGERLRASFTLAQAYERHADRMANEKRYLAARIFAASALFHHPGYPGSPQFDQAFARESSAGSRLTVDIESILDRCSQGPIQKLEQSFDYDEAVTCLSFSHDGQYLAAVDWSGTLVLRDLRTGSEAGAQAHTKRAKWVDFSPDDTLVTSGGTDGLIKVFTVADLTLRQTIDVGGAVTALSFSADGSEVVAGSHLNGEMAFFRVADAKRRLHLGRHGRQIEGMVRSHDGNRLATACVDGKTRVFDIRSGEQIMELGGHTDAVREVAFSPDDELLATTGDDGTIRIWDARTGAPKRLLEGRGEDLMAIGFSPRGNVIVAGGRNRMLQLWDVRDGRLLQVVEGHRDQVTSLAFDVSGRWLATGSYDATVKLWRTNNLEPAKSIKHDSWIATVAFSPDGRWVATGGQDRTVRLWEAQTARLVWSRSKLKNQIQQVAFSPDGGMLASAGYDGRIRLWETATGKSAGVMKRNNKGYFDVAFSPDGQTVAAGATDGRLDVWHILEQRLLHSLGGHDGWVIGVAYSPDDRWLASVSQDRLVRIFDAKSGTLIRRLVGHKDWVSGVAFSGDGRILATSGKDGLVILWETDTWEQQSILTGHKQWANRVAFSPDDRLLASAGDDAQALLWDVASGTLVKKIRTSEEVFQTAFSPDGRRLAMTDDQEIVLYRLDLPGRAQNAVELLERTQHDLGGRLDGFELRLSGGREAH